MTTKELQSSIVAKNRVNQYIKTVAPSIFAVLKQFEGKRLFWQVAKCPRNFGK